MVEGDTLLFELPRLPPFRDFPGCWHCFTTARVSGFRMAFWDAPTPLTVRSIKWHKWSTARSTGCSDSVSNWVGCASRNARYLAGGPSMSACSSWPPSTQAGMFATSSSVGIGFSTATRTKASKKSSNESCVIRPYDLGSISSSTIMRQKMRHLPRE